MNSIVSACLDSLSKINETDYEYEMLACEQLIESYDKLIKLMEHYTPEQIDNIPYLSTLIPSVVFQEADTNDSQTQQVTNQNQNTDNDNNNNNADQKSDDNKQEKAWEFNPRPNKANGSGKENIIISILAFIPRLIIACIRFIYRSIKNLFSGAGAVKQAEASINDTAAKWGNAPDFEAKAKELMQQLNKDPKYAKTRMFRSFQITSENLEKMAQNTNSVAQFEDADKKGTYYVEIITPVGLNEMLTMLKSVIISHVDKYLDVLQNAIPKARKNEEGKLVVTYNSIKNDTVDAFKKDCQQVINAVKAENDKVAKIIDAQNKAGKLLVEVDGMSPKRIAPEDGLNMMNAIAQLIKNLNTKVNSFAGAVDNLKNTQATGEVEDGVFESLKSFDEMLKSLFTEITKYVNSGAIEVFADAFRGVSVFSQEMAKLIPQHGQQVQPAPANTNNTPQTLTTTNAAANGVNPAAAQAPANNTQQAQAAPQAQPAQPAAQPAKLTTTNQAAQQEAEAQRLANMNALQRAGNAVGTFFRNTGNKFKSGWNAFKEARRTVTDYAVTSRDGSEIISEQKTFDGTVDDWNALLTDTYMAGNAIKIIESHYYDENNNEIIMDHTDYYQDDNITPLEY